MISPPQLQVAATPLAEYYIPLRIAYKQVVCWTRKSAHARVNFFRAIYPLVEKFLAAAYSIHRPHTWGSSNLWPRASRLPTMVRNFAPRLIREKKFNTTNAVAHARTEMLNTWMQTHRASNGDRKRRSCNTPDYKVYAPTRCLVSIRSASAKRAKIRLGGIVPPRYRQTTESP